MKKKDKSVVPCWWTVEFSGKPIRCGKMTPHSSGLCFQHRKEDSRDDKSSN